ncbi:MAG: hypothetical protein WCI67_14645 [Chloroflexales bacterium]
MGHLSPDLDCLAAIWILVHFGPAKDADLLFVPAGRTLDDQPADSDPETVHVDTGGGRFDHHHSADHTLSAAELVRRELAPDNEALCRLVDQVTRIDHAEAYPGRQPSFFNINDLIGGYNSLFPNRPHHVAQAMLPNLDAWYEHEARQIRLERAFARHLEFNTRWGLGIAMQSDDGGSSRLAYSHGAVLYAYRDRRGYMGVAAQHRSDVDLEIVYRDLMRLDGEADWYLHPSHRLLLCGTPKAPPRQRSNLSLEDLVDVLRAGGPRIRR